MTEKLTIKLVRGFSRLTMNHQRNPVLLVHGLYDTVTKFKKMSAYLTALGWSVHSLDLQPNNGMGCLKKLGHQVNDYITKTFPANQTIDLIGFSMGGLVTRYYLQRLGGVKKVQRYISISAPNNGTLSAYMLPYPGILQMRPESPLIRDLNQDHAAILSNLNVTVIWTPFDSMILPASSSLMGVGKEIEFPVLVHAWMASDYRSLAAVANALSEPINYTRSPITSNSLTPKIASE